MKKDISIIKARQNIADSLFLISHYLDFGAGRHYSLLIMLKWLFSWQNTTKITRGIKHFIYNQVQIRGHGHRKGNNESWGNRVLVDAGGNDKQGIYFAWPNIRSVKGWQAYNWLIDWLKLSFLALFFLNDLITQKLFIWMLTFFSYIFFWLSKHYLSGLLPTLTYWQYWVIQLALYSVGKQGLIDIRRLNPPSPLKNDWNIKLKSAIIANWKSVPQVYWSGEKLYL